MCEALAGRPGHYALNRFPHDGDDMKAALQQTLAARPAKDVDVLPEAGATWDDVVHLVDLVNSAGGESVLDTATGRGKRLAPPPPPPPPPPPRH